MAKEIDKFSEWHFYSQGNVADDTKTLLLSGENVVAVYRTVRDMAVFTNKRLILRDTQGMTGSKVETYTIPWRNVVSWSSESAGTLDLDSEVELWLVGGSHLKIKLNRKVDVQKLDSVIASAVLGDSQPISATQSKPADNSSYEAMRARLMGKR